MDTKKKKTVTVNLQESSSVDLSMEEANQSHDQINQSPQKQKQSISSLLTISHLEDKSPFQVKESNQKKEPDGKLDNLKLPSLKKQFTKFGSLITGENKDKLGIVDELKQKMNKSMDNQHSLIMQKMEQYLENLNERKNDITLLKKIVNHLKDPCGQPINLITNTRVRSMSNSLEYITFGHKESQDFDESIYFIQDKNTLCRYSVKNQGLEPEKGGIYAFTNSVYCFKVFANGKFILVGGKNVNEVNALQFLHYQKGKYVVDDEVTKNINRHILGNVYQMHVEVNSNCIFIVDNVNQLVYDGSEKMQHRLMEIHYQFTTNSMSFKLKNHFKHNLEIYHFTVYGDQPNENLISKSKPDKITTYVSDFNGELFELTDNLRKVNKLNSKSDQKRSMGMLDVSESYLYHADFGTTSIRIINRVSQEERIIETGIMTHQIKLLYEYLLIVDMSNIYIFEPDKSQIIATFKTDGEVTVLCEGNKLSKQVYGYTTKGQLFTINLDLDEQTIFPFLEQERIFSISSQTIKKGTHKKNQQKKGNSQMSVFQKKEQFECDEQNIFVFDRRRQLHSLNFEVGKFVPKNHGKPTIPWDDQQKVIMANIDDCAFIAIGGSIYMKKSNDSEIEIIRNGKNQPRVIAMLARLDSNKPQSNWKQAIVMIQQNKRQYEEKNLQNIEFSSQYQIIIHTENHSLFCLNENGQIYHELRQDYYQNFYFHMKFLNQQGQFNNITSVTDRDNLEEITALTFVNIESKHFILIAFKKYNDRQSVLKLAHLPLLTLKGEVFAEVPQLVTCMKHSQDKQYLAVGCINGQILFYHVINETRKHEIFEKFQAHSFKITDMVFICSKTEIIEQSQEGKQKEETNNLEEDLLTVSNKEYLIASVSFDRRIVVHCLKQRMRLFEKDLNQYLEQLCYHFPSNKILIRSRDYHLFELDMNIKLFKDQQINHQTSNINSLNAAQVQLSSNQLTYSELRLEIMRQYLHSELWDQQVACLNYFENSSLVFRKMNIATIAAAFGSRQGLMVAFENGVDLMNTLDGTSLLDLTNSSNIFNEIIFRKINLDEDYIFVSQEDDFFISLLNIDNQMAQEAVKNLLMNSKFTDRNTNMILGNIKSKMSMYETEQRLLTAQDRAEIIDESQEDIQEIVVFKTLKVPLILQRGNSNFIKLLAGLSRMPDNSREQKPIQLLVSHLLIRDGTFVVLMHIPYVVMAILIYSYMMNSVNHFQNGLILGLPMQALIQFCAIYFLFQTTLQIPALIMFARPISMIKLISIGIDYLLVLTTMIFMNSQGDSDSVERVKLFKEKPYLKWCMNIMVICTFWNLLEVLRLFKQTRTMSQYFIYVLWELRSFMLILGIMVFGFTMLEFLNMPKIPSEEEKYSVFKDILMDQYHLIFGTNPNHRNQTLMQKYIYIFFTIFVNTINLNLLISIIGIVLDDLQMKKQARDISTQLDIFLSFNCNFYVAKRLTQCMFHDRFKNILDNRPKYIHYVSTELEDPSDSQGQNDIEGRVKMMIKRQDSIVNEVYDLRTLIKQQQQNFDVTFNKLTKQMQNRDGQQDRNTFEIKEQLRQISVGLEIKNLKDHLSTIGSVEKYQSNQSQMLT